VNKLKLLSENFNHDEIYVEADDYNRTIASAIAHLYGLYPLGTGFSLPDSLASMNLTLPPFDGVHYTNIGQASLP